MILARTLRAGQENRRQADRERKDFEQKLVETVRTVDGESSRVCDKGVLCKVQTLAGDFTHKELCMSALTSVSIALRDNCPIPNVVAPAILPT